MIFRTCSSHVDEIRENEMEGPRIREKCPPVSDGNEVSPGKYHLVHALKYLERIINKKKTNYADKVQSLLVVWEQLAFFVVGQSWGVPRPEFQSLFRYTFRLLLMPDWHKVCVAMRTHMNVTLQRCSSSLRSSGYRDSILDQCRVLESASQKPWSHPTLTQIFDSEEIEFFDLLEYFQFENGQATAIRIEMMLDGKCEELALRLAKSCLTTYNNSEPLELDFNQDELDYIIDAYFCTLYKTKMNKELTAEIKLYTLDEGLELLRRYKRAGGIARGFRDRSRKVRIWKCSDEVVKLIANTLLANAVLNDVLVESNTVLLDLISVWASYYKLEEGQKFSPTVLQMIGKSVLVANSSKCIYPFCSFLMEKDDCKEIRVQVTEWLIRAIYKDMNEIEQRRVNREFEELRSVHERLSEGFVMISKLFNDSKNIHGQCLLIAFLLTPSSERLQILETFVTNILSTIPDHSQYATFSAELDLSSGNAEPAYYLEVQNSIVEECLQSDLITILQYQKNPTLRLELEWSELKTNCEKFLEAFEARGFNYEVELKYLDLDYTQFKDRPVNEEDYIGIEKGYEQFIEIDNNSRPDPENEFIYDSSSSFDDTDEDEEYVLQTRKKPTREHKKKRHKSRFALKKSNQWDDDAMSLDDPCDTQMTARQRKHRMSVQSSDSETCAKKSRSVAEDTAVSDGSFEGGSDVLKICIPKKLSKNFGKSKRGRSPVHGKRLTMRLQIPKTLEVEGAVRLQKPKVVKIGALDLNEELRSILDSLESEKFSSPAAPDSPSQEIWESKTDSEFSGDKAVQTSAMETESVVIGAIQPCSMERQPSDDGARPTIEPIIIRRHVVEENSDKSSHNQRNKLQKKVFYTMSKRPVSSVCSSTRSPSTSRSRFKRRSVPKASTQTRESNVDRPDSVSVYDWDPRYTSLYFTSIEDGT